MSFKNEYGHHQVHPPSRLIFSLLDLRALFFDRLLVCMSFRLNVSVIELVEEEEELPFFVNC